FFRLSYPHSTPPIFPYTTLFRSVRILRPCIKKNSLIIVDGYPMRIRGTTEMQLLMKNGIQPVFVKQERLIRNIEKYLDKNQDYRSEEHTSELQSRFDLVCRLLLE